MGYGLGIFLMALGAILAFAIGDTSVGPINIYLIGIILAVAGLAIVILTAIQLNSGTRGTHGRTTRETTTHPDGSQTTREVE